jgi:selenoprotein W-related protein
LQLDSELKPGPSGSFDIAVNGKTVWKKETFAFPTEKEVVDAVSKELGR